MRALLALAGGGAGGAARAPSRRTPVDTDLSNDDTIALLYLTRRDDVDMRAVTVSGTGLATCPLGARNALSLKRRRLSAPATRRTGNRKAARTRPTTTGRSTARPASDTSSDFETAVVAKAGADEGVIYASCSWGFTVDERLQPAPKAPKIDDKPSKAFYAATDKWNQQARGPVAGRNTPTQEALPPMR